MKILIVDDDPVSRVMLSRMLSRWGYDVVSATDGAEGWHILQQGDAPKLAILDWMMPGMDGLEICRRVRSQSNSYTYILLLTARNDKDDILSGLAAGADDYLVKPVSSAELKARVGVGRRILDLQERLVKAYEETRFQATHDQLTGMWNRPAILERLHAEWEHRLRAGTSFGVLLVDVDHFKRVNDTYGHAVGDAVLQHVAGQMKSSLRPYDSLGRYGGEEFLLILPDCDLDGAITPLSGCVLGLPQVQSRYPARNL